MNLTALNSLVCRVFLIGAFVLLAVALIEKIVNFAGYTVLRDSYTAGRLLEFAGVALLFVMALLLRQIREALKKP